VRKTKLSAKARADLDTIWLYVAGRDGAQAADRLIDRLVETFPLLAAFPRMGKPREDVLPDTRVFPVASYLIFDRKRRRDVEIARVVHGAQDIRRP
jgi:toxin ParE1/3/4